MASNYYEAELMSALGSMIKSGYLMISDDSSYFFEKLESAYPVIGSKIDWECVPCSIFRVCQCGESDFLMEMISFFDEVVLEFGLSGGVVFVGDSAIDFSLKGDIKIIREILPVLLNIPQHHYFMDPEVSWCICFSMEGDMAFGRSIIDFIAK